MSKGQLFFSGAGNGSRVCSRILLGVLLALPVACGPGETGEKSDDFGATGGFVGVGGGVTGGFTGVGGATSGGEAGVGGASSGGFTSGGGGTGGELATGGAFATGGDTSTGGTGGAGTGGSGNVGTGGGTQTCPLPSTFKWTSSGVLAEPKSPQGHDFVSLKDFTVAKAGNKYAVYATAYDSTASWTGVYWEVTDWAEAGSAPQTWLQGRNTVAPQLMYFSPKNIWVLTYQWGFQYATSTDPTNPTSWSSGKSLLTGNPTTGTGGTGPIDQSVICDDTSCYIFFAGDNGRIYRGSMPIGSFPAAFTNSAQIMQDTTNNLFEAVEVYSVKGSNQYLMIVEAIGSGGRYFRAFTADSLGGTWTAMPQASSENTPFAGKKNVTWSGSAWTNDISHGDIVREDPSEKKPIDPCNLRFLYQGRNPAVGGDYGLLPYRPGLLTLSN